MDTKLIIKFISIALMVIGLGFVAYAIAMVAQGKKVFAYDPNARTEQDFTMGLAGIALVGLFLMAASAVMLKMESYVVFLK